MIEQSIAKEKKTSAAISIFSNLILIIIKVAAGILSGSISVLSEALHSFADLSASCLAYFSVSKSVLKSFISFLLQKSSTNFSSRILSSPRR